MLKSNSALIPVAESALVEIYAEAFQDNDRAGYVNFADTNQGSILYWATSDAFLNGKGGDDTIYMLGNTNDTIHGGSGNDYIAGGMGNDTLFGDSGADTLRGDDGNDKLFGGSGNDMLDGGTGDDQLDGGSGDDQLDAGAGNDMLMAGAGNDVLNGGAGDDQLNGGSGNDVLVGGLGKDVLTGGAGADTFVFKSTSESWTGAPDVTTDFERGLDMIDLRMIHGFVTLINQADGQHVHVDMHGGLDLDIVVHTVDGSSLTANDFLWH